MRKKFTLLTFILFTFLFAFGCSSLKDLLPMLEKPTIALPKPSITPASGTYVGSQTVTINSSVADAEIIYTTNGADPITIIDGTVSKIDAAKIYAQQFVITKNTTVKAVIAWNDNYSNVTSANYVITQETTDNSGTETTTNTSSTSTTSDNDSDSGVTNTDSGTTQDSAATSETSTSDTNSDSATTNTDSGTTQDEPATNEDTQTTNTSNNSISANLDRVVVGYLHTFNNGTGIIRLSDVPEEYNVICLAFPDVSSVTGVVSFANVDYFPTAAEISTAHNKGQKILISIGGQNGTVEIDSQTEKEAFVNSIKNLLTVHDLDGVDIDLEGSAITAYNGESVIALIQALDNLETAQGKPYYFTMAPERAYMASGGGLLSNTAYADIIKSEAFQKRSSATTWIQMQYYNDSTAAVWYGNGVGTVGHGTTAYLVNITKEVISRHNLDASQVVIGLPSVPAAAPAGGYASPAIMQEAYDELMQTYPNMRGFMTWSVNWDSYNGNNYAFAKTAQQIIQGLERIEIPSEEVSDDSSSDDTENIDNSGETSSETNSEETSSDSNVQDDPNFIGTLDSLNESSYIEVNQVISYEDNNYSCLQRILVIHAQTMHPLSAWGPQYWKLVGESSSSASASSDTNEGDDSPASGDVADLPSDLISNIENGSEYESINIDYEQEPGFTYTITIDGQSYQKGDTYPVPYTSTDLYQGLHLLKITATDGVGNTKVTTKYFRIGNEPNSVAPSKRVVAYFTNWGRYARSYSVSKIPATKVSHINYAFAGISDSGEIELTDANADTDNPWGDPFGGHFAELKRLKQNYSHLKTLISIGGWTLSGRFSDISSTTEKRAKFVDSVIDFILRYGFDGIDIDWEYPVGGGKDYGAAKYQAGGSPADRENFTALMQEFRNRLDELNAFQGANNKYVLTFASKASSYENMELASLANIVDWINIMSYDYNGAWSAETAHNAPLYAEAGQMSVDNSISTMIAAGVPASKINMGLGLYGRSTMHFTVPENYNGTGLGLTFAQNYSTLYKLGPGSYPDHHPTVADRENDIDFLGYGSVDYKVIMSGYLGNELNDENNSGATSATTGLTYYWDDVAKVPYLFGSYKTGFQKREAASVDSNTPVYATTTYSNEYIFISYDNERSIKAKVDYINAQGLGGAMVWDLAQDDDTSSLMDVIDTNLN